MRIKRVNLHDFSTFADVDVEFSPGINIFIGENSTGKSHLLKLLYSMVKASEESTRRGEAFSAALSKKLDGVYRPDDHGIGRLVRRKAGRGSARVRIEATNGGSASFSLSTLGKIKVEEKDFFKDTRSVFLPSREVLAMYEGFIGLYEGREISFDETYFDACKALNTPALRGPRGQAASRLYAPIEAALGGQVWMHGPRFYLSFDGPIMEAHLVAEGLRKIASVAWLIKNGTLRDNSLLFWDEPEANLNPRLIRRVADFIAAMAMSGVQVFLATHDYLLSQTLSLAKEFATTKAEMRFFSLERGAGGVGVEQGETISDLKTNPILDEFVRHYEYEHQLLQAEQQKGDRA